MTRAEFARRLIDAPRFRYRPPTDAELDELADAYEAMVGRRIHAAVLNLLVNCFRTHGPDTVRLMRELYAELGTTTNLLGQLRLREPGASAKHSNRQE